MPEVILYSLLFGSLGVQALAISGWQYWQQGVTCEQDEEEEEILTQYESKENIEIEQSQLNGAIQTTKNPRLAGWEFKIVRAYHNQFRNPALLQQLCQEEAEAGWILLEKLDDCRVRFKRPMAMRDILKPEVLIRDPYRCHYGSSWQPWTWLAVIAALVGVILPAYLGYALVSKTLANSQPKQTPVRPFSVPESSPHP